MSEEDQNKTEVKKHNGKSMATYLPFLFESIGQVTVGVREVGLKFDGTSVCVDGQVYQPEQRVQIITTRQKQSRCTGETG